LTISASASFAHDFWTNVLFKGKERAPGEEVRVARVTAFVVGAMAIGIAIALGPTANVAFLVALAFAVAASANLPVIVLSVFWKRFNTSGAVAGLATGLVASITLILIGPSVMKEKAILPLENPGIVSIPLGFLGALVGALSKRDPDAEAKFVELTVRANTGLGAEKATHH
jgi:cation/acetate symporter